MGLFATILGHIGDGNFHMGVLYNRKDPKERAAVEKCVYSMVDRALEMDGTCTGEVGFATGVSTYLLTSSSILLGLERSRISSKN